MTQLTVAYFAKEIDQRLVKPSLKFNSGLAKPKENETIEPNCYLN